MFWKEARARYPKLGPDDPDIRRFNEVAAESQREGYEGLVGWIQDLGHRWIAGRSGQGRTLEIGFGQGRHSKFHAGDPTEYFVSELNSSHCGSPEWAALRGRATICSATAMPFAAASFDTVISVYNLEHIPALPQVLAEVHRVLKPGGRFLVGLPCEGGLAWNLGRELTTRRHFLQNYGINYDKVIAYEHVWDAQGVLDQLHAFGRFRVAAKRHLPFFLPSKDLNLILCLDCQAF